MGQHSKLYNSAQWRARRARQLAKEPVCRFCARLGIVGLATVADHIEPHHGDPTKFWRGELQSLCKLHHDSTKKLMEAGIKRQACDADGWPVADG
jgi:5-methylcytosine-specific restriction enzyme A